MRRLHKVVTILLVLSMLVTSVVATAVAADVPAVEQDEATTSTLTSPVVAALLPGGQFAKIWLALTPETLDQYVTVTAEWDRENASNSAVGFFVLSPANLQAVQNGGSLQANNLASGSPQFQQPLSIQYTRFFATYTEFTLVLYNDSADDANVKVTVSNGTLSDDSGQVTDPTAPADATPAAEAPAAEAAPVAATAATTATATTATATTTDTAATATAATTATTATTTAVVTPTAAVAAPAVVATEPFVLRTDAVQGALPNLNDQHFLGLEPEQRDGEIKLTLTYDPQDNSELSRRLNFWVLDNSGFNLYVAGTNASEVAIAAGNRTFSGQSNERVATFQATGFGPYTVIVYNNSQVPATYSLSATGAALVDDSLQTTTAQEQAPAGGLVAAAGTATTATTTAPAATATTATTATAAATTARVGEPGGTYTVAAGDTVALIARDVYGDFSLYAEICAFNNIADCARIEVGDVLKLPTQAQIDAGAVSTTTVSSTAAATPVATPAPVATTAATTTTAASSTAATTSTTPAATPAATPTRAASTSAAAGNTLVDVATENGNFTILIKALVAAGLDDELAADGTLTVFAPTDAAFNALGQATVDALLKDTAKLREVLLFHVVGSEVLSTDLEDGLEVKTLQGGSISFDLSGATPKVQDSLIIVADQQADNGVLHVIDKVMLPS